MSLRKQIKRAMARRVAQDGVKETMAYLDKINTQTTVAETMAREGIA